MSRIVFEHVDKRYPNAEALTLKDMQLDISDGEFLVLVGPSGCGKTTALRCLAGLEDITGGRILIGEKVVNDLPPKERDLAMVFQSYALYPHMTVFENMAFSIRLHKVPKAEMDQRVHEAARILALENFLDRKPGQLSGGQRQRVALGRAIVRNPAAFLMDEPLSNLDAKLRVQTRAEIARLHQRLETTIVYVTHDQVEAMTMGDRIAVMNLGIIQQAGTPQELYERPVNRFVAGFIGSPAMNFLTGRIASNGGDPTLKLKGLDVSLKGRTGGVARKQGDGSELTIGIRPEHFELATADMPKEKTLTVPAVVDVVEFLGNDELIHTTLAETDIVAIVRADRHLKVGDKVDLAVPENLIHAFDPLTEVTLTSDSQAAA